MDEATSKFYKLDAMYLLAGGTTTTEKEFASWVKALAVECDWLIYHVPDSRRAPAGFPDLVLLKPPSILLFELKRYGKLNTVSPLQRQWIEGLQACGLEAGVWTPSEIPQIWLRLTGTPYDS